MGSEMCIRDSLEPVLAGRRGRAASDKLEVVLAGRRGAAELQATEFEVWSFGRFHLSQVCPLNKTNTPGSEDRGWELGEAGNDECIEDCGSGRLILSCFIRF